MTLRVPLLVAGTPTASSSGSWFPTHDPATGQIIAEVASGDRRDVDRCVESAADAVRRAGDWHSPAIRARTLNRVATLLRDASDELAIMESRDTGKPLSQARADAEACARYFEYYAGASDKLDGRSIPLGPSFVDYTVREPWGVCAVVVPWNYPLQIVGRCVAAALGAGNAIVVKPASEAPLTTLRLARICHEAGVPPGWLNVVTGSGEEVGMPLATHALVDHVTFTGSAKVGVQIGEACARLIRPMILELGGKSPQIVFRDADLGRVVPTVIRAIVQNAGQTCSAGARLLVDRSVHNEVIDRVASGMELLRLGAGLTDPDLGPLISSDQRIAVLRCIDSTRSTAQLVTGGAVPDDDDLSSGWFIQPTLFDNVHPDSEAFREEVFGPVLVAATFDDEDQAVFLANATDYGLVAAVWTNDLGRAHRVARQIRAGQVFINTYGAGGGVELPFGGYGRSGYGRGKGIEGILEYTQVKNVCVAL